MRGEPPVERAVDEQLRRALQQVDHRRAQLTAHAGLPASARRASRPVSHGTTVAASTSATSTTSPAAGSSHHSSATVAPPASQRDRERRQDPQQQVLQRVDVVDEPRQQIALAERGQPGRRERLEPAVDA